MQKHTPLSNSTRINRRHRANFARQATIDAFGWRFAKALDQSDFVDRRAGDLPRLSPEARQ